MNAETNVIEPEEQIPIVDVVLLPALSVGEERRWLVLRCVYCDRQHRHGAGKPGQNPADYLGSRWSHCGAPYYFGPGGEYRLRWIEQDSQSAEI